MGASIILDEQGTGLAVRSSEFYHIFGKFRESAAASDMPSLKEVLGQLDSGLMIIGTRKLDALCFNVFAQTMMRAYAKEAAEKEGSPPYNEVWRDYLA